MSEIVIDAARAEQLLADGGLVVVKDDAGRMIGWFRPRPDPATDDPYELGISREELDRRANSPGPWYTTEQVLAYVKGLVK